MNPFKLHLFVFFSQVLYNRTFIIVGSIVHSEVITSVTIFENGLIVVVNGKVRYSHLFIILTKLKIRKI